MPSAYHADYSCMCTRFHAIFDWSFGWGLPTPNFGKGKVVQGRGSSKVPAYIIVKTLNVGLCVSECPIKIHAADIVDIETAW